MNTVQDIIQDIAVLYTGKIQTYNESGNVRFVYLKCNLSGVRSKVIENVRGHILTGMIVVDDGVGVEDITFVARHVRPIHLYQESKDVTVTIQD